MAEIVWTEPALGDLDAIADYIALDNPRAAARLVQRVFVHVGQLSLHPRSGSKVPELKGWRYRQIVEPPCRVLYRVERGRVLILHVVRSERLLRGRILASRAKSARR
jgi:plasmid stabilization system protein ParE